MANGGEHRQLDGGRVEGTAGGAPPDASAAARRGVTGDRFGALPGTARKQAEDLCGETFAQIGVLAFSTLRVAPAAPRSRLLVREGLLLRALECLPLDQNALALVPPAGAAEAHDHGRQPTRALGAAGQCSVAGREEDEVVEVGAGEAERPGAYP